MSLTHHGGATAVVAVEEWGRWTIAWEICIYFFFLLQRVNTNNGNGLEGEGGQVEMSQRTGGVDLMPFCSSLSRDKLDKLLAVVVLKAR